MEKSQHQIRFESLYYNSMGRWWGSCKFKTQGNIIHWVYVFSENLDTAEQVCIGNDVVTLHGKHFANVELNDKLQMPIFTNIDWHEHFETNQTIYHEGLKQYKDFTRQVNKQYRDFGSRNARNTCIQNKRVSLNKDKE